MKFSDVVMATVSVVLIGLALDAVLLVAFVPLNSNAISDLLAFIVSFLATSLAVGSVFALKIQEVSRIKAASYIAVLSAFTLMLFLGTWIANPFASPYFKDTLAKMFNMSGWTNYEWSAYAAFLLSVDVVVGFVLSFVGLYAGSMLRKPKETKEKNCCLWLMVKSISPKGEKGICVKIM